MIKQKGHCNHFTIYDMVLDMSLIDMIFRVRLTIKLKLNMKINCTNNRATTKNVNNNNAYDDQIHRAMYTPTFFCLFVGHIKFVHRPSFGDSGPKDIHRKWVIENILTAIGKK